MSADLVPPAVGEIEISVFGRGYGECVVAHIGSGQWVIVDSLRGADREPAALAYLRKIGVSSSNIRLIVATHWHDDHVDGLGEIYEAAENARLAIPIAMKADEWQAFQGRVRIGGSEHFTSGVSELERVADVRARTGRAPIILTRLNHNLLRVPGSELAHGLDVDIEALSPGDEDIAAFLRSVGSVTGTFGARRIQPFDRNDVSIAAWLRLGSHRLLLGADLEDSGAHRGWEAILASPAPLDGQANVIKVAHHGSKNGFHPGFWIKHVSDAPVTALATWCRAGRRLPTPTDIERISAQSERAYAASKFDAKTRARPAVVEKTIRQNGYVVKSRPKDVGQVRMRFSPTATVGAAWRVDLFGGAVPLRDLLEA